MNITVLGGGNEVGASCLYVELDGTRILIDAGMRMHDENALPMLGMLPDLGGIDAILVTHAHADHIGALPIVHSLYPSVPIYTTPPTLDLMKIMLPDSHKILEMRCQQNHTLVPYTEEQVQRLLDSILMFPQKGELQLGKITVRSYRAGHILGAVMFEIAGQGETLLVTGDLSFRAGRTIPGAKVPPDLKPDVVVIESTYGNRAHVDRNTEEKRLAENVAEVIGNGGFVLIPAFALGRAQEILLVLQDYMDKGLIPAFPIYVDGLVTPISRVYRDYPHYLKGPVAHRINKTGDAFLVEGRCIPVQPKQREQVLQGKPACIVASSGMLTGGASVWYAEKLVGDPKNAIFITGYQDEESPGRKLLNLAEGRENILELNGTTYQVQCRVDKYGLSAHADALEIKRFIEALEPTHTLLVHGDDDARGSLMDHIDPRYTPTLVENGNSYVFEKRASGKGVKGKRYRTDKEIQQLQDKVGSILLFLEEEGKVPAPVFCTRINPKNRTLHCQVIAKEKTVQATPSQIVETIGPWNQSMSSLQKKVEKVKKFSRRYLKDLPWHELTEGTFTLDSICIKMGIEDVKERIAVALALLSIPAPQQHQESLRDRTYHLTSEIIQQLTDLSLPIPYLRLNPTQTMELIRNELQSHPRFLRCGIDQMGTPSETMMIHFDFPHAVSEGEKQEIAQRLFDMTGWPITFSSSVRLQELAAKIENLLGHRLPSDPSVHLENRVAIVDAEEPPNWQEIQQILKAETGFTVRLRKSAGQSQQPSSTFTAEPRSNKALENNKAIEVAKKWAQKLGVTIYKTSIREQTGDKIMELHFISPQIGRQYEVEMSKLASQIGMVVTYTPHPKQNEILRISKELTQAWSVHKNPSIHMDRGVVGIKVLEMPGHADIEKANDLLVKQTGYRLEVSLKRLGGN